MQLDHVTTYDVQTYLEHKKTIIIPFGAIEQHGPHLPIGTDTFIAKALAQEAGKQSQTMVAPVVPVGFSPGLHPHFAGTISLRATTCVHVIQDILQSLLDAGFEDLLVVTGHVLNYSPLKTALLDLLNTQNARVLLMGYWEFDELQPLLEPGDGVHCTILETSLMLYLHSDLVDMDKGLDEYKKPRFLLGTDAIREISTSGIIAETMKASPEKGKRYFDAAIAGLIRAVQSFESAALFDE